MALSTTRTHVRRPDDDATPPGPLFCWKYHPWRDQPRYAVAAAAAVTAAALLTLLVTSKFYLAGAVALAGAIIVSRAFIPVTYEVEVEGLRQTMLGRQRLILWKSIGEAQALSDGLLLKPRSHRNARSSLRGLYVPCGHNLSDVCAGIEAYAPWAANWTDAPTNDDLPSTRSIQVS